MPSRVLNDETFKEVTTGSDRTAAIVLAAEVDDAIGNFIKSRFVPDKDTAHKLFKPSGPLGAFATKADLAYLMDLIDVETRDDLYLIAEIRNRFAHWAKPVTFADREIGALCNKITFPDRYPGTEPPLDWQNYEKPTKGPIARMWFAISCSVYSGLFDKTAERYLAEHR